MSVLQNIDVEILCDDHKFIYSRTMFQPHYYAVYSSGEFVLRLGIAAGNIKQDQILIYKNVAIRSHGIKSSRWKLVIYNESENKKRLFPDKTLISNTNNFEYIFKDQTDKYTIVKFNKKGVKEIAAKSANAKLVQSDAVEDDKFSKIEDQIFNACIAKNQSIYELIEDKDAFRESFIRCADFEDLVYWLSVEDYDNDINFKEEFDKEVEKFSDNCSIYFQKFLKSEHCRDLASKKLTAKLISKYYPNVLLVVDESTLKLIINQFMINFNAEEYGNYKSIDFDEKDFLEEAAKAFFNEKLKALLQSKLKEKFTRDTLSKVYANEISIVSNQQDLLNELEKYVKTCEETDEQALLSGLKNFIDLYIEFDDYSKKFYSAFDTKSMRLKLSADKEARFIAFKNGETELNETERNEYDLIYKTMMPIYKSYMYIKGTNRLKPTILQIPLYFDYVRNFFEHLIKDEIIVENKGAFDFKDINKVENLEKEVYDPLEFYKKI